jgi:SAM-dependent methyltransferase
MSAVPTVDLAAVKVRQQATWASGDFARVATLIVPMAEILCDAADLRAGSKVLDVACGSGNGAIAAARLNCDVIGVDYVPALLDRARERAAAERLDVDFRDGDAEALPFADATFDSTITVVGSMFAADHHKAAAELVRVTKPGGTIGLASWKPSGFIGQMFRTTGKHVPPPAGVSSPLLWGTEEHLGELFGDDVAWTHRERTFTWRFTSAAAFVECFATYYGPTVKALEAAGAGREALLQDLEQLAASADELGEPGAIRIPATYLESVGRRV